MLFHPSNGYTCCAKLKHLKIYISSKESWFFTAKLLLQHSSVATFSDTWNPPDSMLPGVCLPPCRGPRVVPRVRDLEPRHRKLLTQQLGTSLRGVKVDRVPKYCRQQHNSWLLFLFLSLLPRFAMTLHYELRGVVTIYDIYHPLHVLCVSLDFHVPVQVLMLMS